ncbi:MAG: calcium-binding protein [Planctomycetota bacterium]
MCSKMASTAWVLVVVSISAAVLVAQSTTRVSVDSFGGQGRVGAGGDVPYPYPLAAISADGRLIAFDSKLKALVAGDTNAARDVFVNDRQTGATTRVSVDSSGMQGNNHSYYPAISADGRYVVFTSIATNLVPGDANGAADVFVHDRQTGETARVSVDSQGSEANWVSWGGGISADGRRVVFNSAATNLVPGDTNGSPDVFVHDRQTGATTRASVDSQGGQADADSQQAVISADGRFVAFFSWADNLVPGDTTPFRADIFVHDLATGETTRVSVDSNGAEGNGGSDYPSISADGRFVSFDSSASNLVPGDTNGWLDVFVHDRQTGATTRVSVDSQGVQGNFVSDVPALSGDGRFVAFQSWASNLVAGDTNQHGDVFVHDLLSGETSLASLGAQGEQGNNESVSPAISADGRFAAFTSHATNLVLGDTNGFLDAFVRDRTGPCSSPASWANYGSGWPGTNGIPGLIARSNPVLCGRLDVLAENSAGADTTGVLFGGFTNADIVTAWNGTVLVLPALITPVLVPFAGLSITTTIPCDDSLCGLTLFVQVVETDVGASHGVSFTPGLELRLGVQ